MVTTLTGEYAAGGPPPPALAPFVSRIAYFRGRYSHERERVLPSGRPQLLINMADDALWWQPEAAPPQRTEGAAVLGPTTLPGVVDTAHQRAVIYVSLRPTGAHLLLPVPPPADQLVPLADLWGRNGSTLRPRLCEAASPGAALAMVAEALYTQAARRAGPGTSAPDPALAVAARALHRGATVAEVSDRLGRTPRWVTRWFTERVGVSPKRFARVRRFQRLVAAATSGSAVGATPDRDSSAGRAAGGDPGGERVDWARLAAECGYHDQSHMIHEFRSFAGMRPTDYLPRSSRARNHVPR